MLAAKLETMAPSWAIFDFPTHLISTPAWEKLVVLDHI